MKLTGLASDTKKKQSVSPVLPRTDFLQPKPPPGVAVAPHAKRPALLGKTKHRLSLQATQLSLSSPNPLQRQELDLENSQIYPVLQNSSASSATVQSSPNESEFEFVGSATCRLKAVAPTGHFGVAPTPLIPMPPAEQTASSRGQRVNRHLTLHQTENLLSAT